MEGLAIPAWAGPTTTQVGAIGESLTAAGILHGSGGRLSPFKPIADDDGLDLLVFDKLSRKPIPLQIKARRGFDDARAQTVQFDVRLKTFAAQGAGYLLCVNLNGLAIEALWLIPAADLPRVARTASDKLVMVASTKSTSQDRYTPYRMKTFEDVCAKLIASQSV